MSFIDEIKKQAKTEIKTIVLPEATDIRTLEATDKIIKEGFAKIVLIGNKEEITKLANDNNFDISKANIVEPLASDKYLEYAEYLYELRKAKGMTLEQAKNLLKDPVYWNDDGKKRRSRWISIRSCTFYSRYFKASASNIKNKARN